MRLLRDIGACVVLGAALTGVGCSQPMAEGPLGDLEMGIFGGTPTTDWDSVVFLFSEGGMCTGVVVESEVVLTAAHCLEGIWGTVEVYWGDDLAQGNWEHYGSSNEYHMHPYYDSNTLTHDIGVLRLNEPSPTDPIPINCDPPDAFWIDPSDPLTGVGFGMVYPDPGSGGVKMEAPIAFESCTTNPEKAGITGAWRRVTAPSVALA